MSEIKANKLSNEAGTGPTELEGQAAAKSWSRVTGSGTPVLDDSLNCSSVTDNATGKYTLTLASAISKISATGGCIIPNHPGAMRVNPSDSTTISVFHSQYYSTGYVDPSISSIQAHGDLA